MKYIAFYNDKNHLYENRYVNSAAATVIEYMVDVFSTYGNLEIIAPTRTLNEKGIYRARKTKLSSNITLKVPFTVGVKTKIGKSLVRLYTQLWLLWELLFNTDINETVVFYHSLSTMYVASIVMKVKKLNIILEYREIYSDINSVNKSIKKKEVSYWKGAKAMILPSKSLKKILGVTEKKCLYVPGTYKANRKTYKGFSDKKIHIVYAGNLRPEKGGAYIAIDCAKFLNSDYIIHILGNGSKSELLMLQERVKSVTALGKAEVKYEGFKSGKELTDFISMCHIGLAVQKKGAFSNSSFPSKILLYLTNGVNVISPKIDAVTMSSVAGLITFYDGDKVEDIAESILNMNRFEAEEIANELYNLDNELKRDWKKLLVSNRS